MIWTYLGLTVAAIPFLFMATGQSRVDRYVGELSFPVYITHILVLMFLGNLLPHRAGGFHPSLGLSTLAVSTALSVAMIKFLIRPIDRIRHHLPSARVVKPAFLFSATPSRAT